MSTGGCSPLAARAFDVAGVAGVGTVVASRELLEHLAGRVGREEDGIMLVLHRLRHPEPQTHAVEPLAGPRPSVAIGFPELGCVVAATEQDGALFLVLAEHFVPDEQEIVVESRKRLDAAAWLRRRLAARTRA